MRHSDKSLFIPSNEATSLTCVYYATSHHLVVNSWCWLRSISHCLHTQQVQASHLLWAWGDTWFCYRNVTSRSSSSTAYTVSGRKQWLTCRPALEDLLTDFVPAALPLPLPDMFAWAMWECKEDPWCQIYCVCKLCSLVDASSYL